MRLLPTVEELLAAEQSTEALNLVAALQALGDVLGEPLLSTARRAQWRLDRAYRQGMDARSLAHYLPRPEVESALVDLVYGKTWALHLLGDGGVGKTMTVRDLASGQFARRHGMPNFAVGRVDFDHLDPRFPHRRPAELLLALAADLTGYTTTRDSYSWSRSFEDEAESLHEQLVTFGDAPPDAAMLDAALDTFAEFLDALLSPVILVLDTCEELAKLYGPGGRAPAIDHTFDLLERLRERTPTMRVLLAGRRWLTPAPQREHSAGLTLDDRPYLEIVPIGGFTRDQAATYLDLRDPTGTVPPPLRTALLTASARDGADINPFDLAGYCAWALDEPDLDPARLSTADDPYIERRVIDRVPNSAVRDCLPVAVELGRFDRAMIEPYLRRRGIDAERAFSGLVSQEWVSTVDFDSNGRPDVIEVDDQLLGRLRTAISAQPTRFPLDRAQLGRDLAALVTAGPVENLAVEAVEGALRLLPVAEAATMWATLEERITEADAWGWAQQAAPRAAAVESDRARSDEPTILSAILATQACAILRQPGTPGVAAVWRAVVDSAQRHPDAAAGRVLYLRGLCGQVAAAPATTTSLVSEALFGWQVSSDIPLGPFLAVADAAQRLDPDDVPDTLLEIAKRLRASPVHAAQVLGNLIVAGCLLAKHDRHNALNAATRALDVAYTAKIGKWADWVAPARLIDRVRLAMAVVTPIRDMPPTWREDALDHTSDIDAERLVAATIDHERAWRPIAARHLVAAAEAETYEPSRQPTLHWHRAVPSLRVVVALELAAIGRNEEAVAQLRDRREAAISTGEDPTTVAECNLALLTLCRTLRDTTSLPVSIRRMATEGWLGQREQAWAALALVDGNVPTNADEAGTWRTLLRTSTFDRLPHPPQTEPDPIDRLEYRAMIDGFSPTITAELTTILRQAQYSAHNDVTEFATALRAAALLQEPIENLGQPPRLAAQVAFAEGELLALRFPVRAAPLLRFAADQFTACGDALAASRASVLTVLTLARTGADLSATSIKPEPADSSSNTGWTLRQAAAVLTLSGSGFQSTGTSPELLGLRPAQAKSVPSTSFHGRQPPQQSGWVPTAEPTGVSDTYDLAYGSVAYGADADASDEDASDEGGGDEGGGDEGGGDTADATPQGSTVFGAFVAKVTGLGRLRRRRTSSSSHHSVGFHLDSKPVWRTCVVAFDENDYLIPWTELGPVVFDERAPRFADLPSGTFRSPKPYTVVPLAVGRERAADNLEQAIGTVNPKIGRTVPLFIRIRRRSGSGWERALFTELRGPARSQTLYYGPRMLAAPSPNGTPGTFHLVGTPLETSAGWRMRIDDVGGYGQVSSSVGSDTTTSPMSGYGKTGRGTRSGEILLGPDDLPASGTRLVVLQAEPVDGNPRTLHRLRTGMCELAYDFADRGVAVLVIPPLPDREAARIATRMATTFSKPDVSPVDLLDMVHDIRSRIASQERDERSSLDVILMV
jgi:hypothetical protein